MKRFRIDIPQAAIDDLHDRLDRARWPDELPDAGWEYGIPLGYLRDLTRYWRHEFDWRTQETALNAFDQFVTEIDGARVHFVWARSPEAHARPLLALHGWPGSFAELSKLIGPLTDPRAHGLDPRLAFDVVVPSLPGFGFSGPTRERGWGHERVARAMATLMAELGAERYLVHGGDWGSEIGRLLGVIDADHVSAVHLTMMVSAGARRSPEEPQSDLERRGQQAAARYTSELSGYVALQSTRPQTLSYALTDSPVGQLAWIAEKFRDWTDSADVPEDAVDRDQLLTNVSIYWFTATAGSSARLYWESWHAPSWGAAPLKSSVPTALAVFPRDIDIPSRRIAERYNRIVRFTEMERGGHFPAMEAPELLIADLREFSGSV